MSAPKHTPGPWWVDAKSFAGVETFTVRGPKGQEVAAGQHIAPRRKADARLIAAAPDLLETMKALLVVVGSWEDPEAFDAAEFKAAHAAIAKAEGT